MHMEYDLLTPRVLINAIIFIAISTTVVIEYYRGSFWSNNENGENQKYNVYIYGMTK